MPNYNVTANLNSTIKFKLTDLESSFAMNEALLIRSGIMSDVIPLRLTDILLDRLKKPFVLKV